MVGISYRQTANWRVQDGDVLGHGPAVDEVGGGEGGIRAP